MNETPAYWTDFIFQADQLLDGCSWYRAAQVDNLMSALAVIWPEWASHNRNRYDRVRKVRCLAVILAAEAGVMQIESRSHSDTHRTELAFLDALVKHGFLTANGMDRKARGFMRPTGKLRNLLHLTDAKVIQA